MRKLKSVVSCGLLATTAGCMQYLVQPPAPSLAGSPQTVQVKSYLGSEVQQPPYVLAQRCVEGEQMARVLVKRDFWQGFVSWISLGLIAPATIVYTCANAGDPPLGTGGSGGDN
jgi:hypothetical protein